MLAAPVDAIPEGPNLVYEPKWDGWRAIAFRGVGDVYLQSRAGRNLTPYFPDITRAVRAAVPPGVVLDGELVAWQRGRTSFAQLQRRVTAGRGLLRFAHEHPVYYVVFDLLVDVGAELVISLPLSERRARLVRLLTGARPQLAVTPQTQDLEEVSQWLTAWVVAGVEGIVIKRLDSRYEPGRRGWAKFRIRANTEAIIGGITGSLRNPATLLLGRFDRHGRLRYTGRTHPLTTPQRAELAMLLSPLVLPYPDAVVHPWPQPLPAGWTGQFDEPEPLPYIQVQPTVVADIEVDTAFEHRRWRHRVWYRRPRHDLSVYDVPLLLNNNDDPVSTSVAS